jgi:hypothetical protein
MAEVAAEEQEAQRRRRQKGRRRPAGVTIYTAYGKKVV